MAEGLLWQTTFPELANEVMLEIVAPFLGAGTGQV
jgi:hypothetical protein